MRSASRHSIALVGLLGLATPLLAGCESTFDQNARAKLAAERRLAAQEPQVVTERGPDVRVQRVTLLRSGADSAVVVDVRSRAALPLSDVPISVGVRRGTRKILLNGGADLEWFQKHLPVVPARGEATWVLRTPNGVRTRAGDVPFVRIGAPSEVVQATTPRVLPRIASRLIGSTATSATVEITRVDIPQLGLPVSVVARRGTVPVAAGTVSLPSIDRGETVTAEIPLIGRAGKAPLQTAITPTIFQ